jgi:predicted transposase YbfD/YdcC
MRRTLLRLTAQEYSACLARFFEIEPLAGETIAVDGKVLRGSSESIGHDPNVDSHPTIMLVTAYIVERGLILEPDEVDVKTNEITAIPAFIKQMALQGVVFAFDAISTQKKRMQRTLRFPSSTRLASLTYSVRCTKQLIQIWAIARNFTLNLYRNNGSCNMAQVQRNAGFGLSTLKTLFRMK